MGPSRSRRSGAEAPSDLEIFDELRCVTDASIVLRGLPLHVEPQVGDDVVALLLQRHCQRMKRSLLIGDQNQNDINKRYVAFDFFIDKILGEDKDIFHYKFGRADIVRHPLLIKIVDNYEKAQMEGSLPDTKNKN